MRIDAQEPVSIEHVDIEHRGALEDLVAEIKRETVLKRGGNQLLGEFLDQTKLVARLMDDQEDSLALRAAVNEVTVGLVWAIIQQNLVGEGICVVRILAVDPKFRKRGIGGQLFRAARVWAASCGAGSIEVIALPGDRHTKNFCEQNGLVARSLVMHQYVAPPTTP